jgi:hypothetical protein
MKLTQGSIAFYDIPLSETTGTTGVMIKIGDDERVLSCSVALDPLGRHFDSTLVANALRSMARVLEDEA